MGDFRITIEGEPTGSDRARGGEPMPIADAEAGGVPNTMERTRVAFAERNRWRAEATAAKVDLANANLHRIDTESSVEAEAAARALENGDFNDHTARLARIAELKVLRGQVEAERRHYESIPRLPADPVEAVAQNRTPEAAAWLRAHPEYVLDERKAAKATAAHHDALANDLEPDSPAYFDHVEKFIGLRNSGNSRRGRGDGGSSDGGEGSGGAARVTVLKRGEAPVPGTRLVKMRRSEYEAATQHLTWGYDDPHGRFKKSDPIGVAEYLRRRQIQDSSPEWQRLDG